jgi:hypothetical protein
MKSCRVAAALLPLLAQAAWPQGVIRLKTRSFSPAAAPGSVRPGRTAAAKPQHDLILFASYPGPDVLTELARRRIQVLAYVPENALLVSALVLNLQGLNVTWAGPMDPADKISPVIAAQPPGAYLVIFQPDTDLTADRELVQNLGFAIMENADLLAYQLVVSGAVSGLPGLAASDAVAYILPASADLQAGIPVMGCGGALTTAGPVAPVAQYVLVGNGWSPDPGGGVALQYSFDSFSTEVSQSLVESEVARAFAEWTQYANVTITPASQPQLARSIDILFARWAHGDAYPFTGPGGVLAHTFYPASVNSEPIAGDMHLNADESWSVAGTGNGNVDLYSVVLHETGHALGLGHSDDPSSVMYPYYRLQTGLTADDIAGIQALYGAKVQVSAPPSSGTGSSGSGSTGISGTSGSGSAGASGTGGATSSAPDTAPPTLTIVSPSSTIVSSYAATISFSGTAGDNVAVTAVKWTTSTGSAGDANGTTSWSAIIPLLVGDNTVTVRAYDAAGNSTWRAVTVVRH